MESQYKLTMLESMRIMNRDLINKLNFIFGRGTRIQNSRPGMLTLIYQNCSPDYGFAVQNRRPESPSRIVGRNRRPKSSAGIASSRIAVHSGPVPRSPELVHQNRRPLRLNSAPLTPEKVF